MKKILIISLLLFSGGCAYHNPLSDMQFQTTPAPPYIIANWYKIEKPGQPLKIYIEGDGFNQNSDNPTPTGDFMRRLASDDSSPNVAYIARPCQYLQVACSKSDWTSNQFSPQIIASMDKTMMALMKKAKAEKMVLIGFASGAQIATLIAEKHPKQVDQIITISPVWNSHVNLSESLKSIPQVHYMDDKENSKIKLNGKVIVVPNAHYDTGFKSIYQDIYEVQ